MADSKRALRSRLRAARAAADRAPVAAAVATGLLATARDAGILSPHPGHGPHGPLAIAAYIASPGEPDVGPIRAAVRDGGGVALLPIPGRDRQLAWAMDEGHYQMDPKLPVQVPGGEPIGSGLPGLTAHGVGLVLVPALAVDETGTRLGQGGGYYDRLLSELAGRPPRAGEGASTDRTQRLRGGILAVAVVHDDEFLPGRALPRQAHDQPVDAVLTPTRFVTLNA